MLDLLQRQAQPAQAGVGVERQAVVGDEPTPHGGGVETHDIEVMIMPTPGGIRIYLAHQRQQPGRVGYAGLQR